MERIKKGESLEKGLQDFAGGPVVKNVLPVQGHGFNPWLENQDYTCLEAWPKNKTKIFFKVSRDEQEL